MFMYVRRLTRRRIMQQRKPRTCVLKKTKLTATVLIGSVKAILFAIAEETALDAVAITAR